MGLALVLVSLVFNPWEPEVVTEGVYDTMSDCFYAREVYEEEFRQHAKQGICIDLNKLDKLD